MERRHSDEQIDRSDDKAGLPHFSVNLPGERRHLTRERFHWDDGEHLIEKSAALQRGFGRVSPMPAVLQLHYGDGREDESRFQIPGFKRS